MRSCQVAVLLGFSASLPLGMAAASAALAPPFERQRELIAIIQDPGVLAKVGVIEKIEALAPGRFRVSSRRCAVEVSLVSDPAAEPVAGAPPLRVSMSAPACK